MRRVANITSWLNGGRYHKYWEQRRTRQSNDAYWRTRDIRHTLGKIRDQDIRALEDDNPQFRLPVLVRKLHPREQEGGVVNWIEVKQSETIFTKL